VSEKKPAKKRAPAAVKSTTRKSTTPRARRPAAAGPRALVVAPPEKRFWVNYGPILKDLHELGDALAHSISDAQFAYHVSAGRNDFANWVEAVLHDVACAKALQRAKTRVAALRAVKTHLTRTT
jgi:hypothetical protein